MGHAADAIRVPVRTDTLIGREHRAGVLEEARAGWGVNLKRPPNSMIYMGHTLFIYEILIKYMDCFKKKMSLSRRPENDQGLRWGNSGSSDW